MYTAIVFGLSGLVAAIIAFKERKQTLYCLQYMFMAMGLFLVCDTFCNTHRSLWLYGPQYILLGMLMELARRYESEASAKRATREQTSDPDDSESASS